MGRLRDLGFADVAMAVAYHAGRWLTPWDADGPVRFLEDGVVHFAPQRHYGVLRPIPGTEVGRGETPLASCVRRAGEHGLESHAWTVLFHNTALGTRHPDCTVRNAFGNTYPYALCPAREEVRRFGVTLVRDVADQAELAAVELEALGWMGHRHGSHHDKSSFGSEPFTDFLLSYCFCDACRSALTELGVDAGAVAKHFVALVRERLEEGDALSRCSEPETAYRALEEALDGVLPVLLRHRQQTVRRTLAEIRELLPKSVQLTLHVHLDPLFTGSQVGGPPSAVADLVDELIVTHYGETPEQMEKRWCGQPEVACRVRLAIWPKAPQFRGEKDLQRVFDLVSEHGLDGVRVYHLGLLPWRTIERTAAALSGG